MKKLIIIITINLAFFGCKSNYTAINTSINLKDINKINLKMKPIENFDSLYNTKNSYKINIGETNKNSIVNFFGQPDDVFVMQADGTYQNKTVKKTFFGKKTIITNGFSGFKIKSYTYKEYGLVFKFSKEYSDEISSEIVVTDIEIFDNTNLEVKRSKQYYRYNDQIFDSINQQTIIKIFGNSFVKKETEKTVCYTFLDRKISFIFNKVNNNFIVVSIANNKL